MNNQNNFNSNIEEIKKMYPYGNFPTKYTKKQKEVDINNPKIFNYVKNNTNYENPEKPTESNKDNKNNFDLKNILPLLSNLGNKKTNSTDMLSNILPLLLGNKSKDITTLLKMFNNKPKEVQNLKTDNLFPETKYKALSSYTKVD